MVDNSIPAFVITRMHGLFVVCDILGF